MMATETKSFIYYFFFIVKMYRLKSTDLIIH